MLGKWSRTSSRKTATGGDIVSTLPEELSCMVLKELCARDLAVCCMVSSTWREKANRNVFWRRLLELEAFKGEALLSLKATESGHPLVEECHYKRLYNRSATVIHDLKNNAVKEINAGARPLTPLGSGSLLAFYLPGSVLLLEEGERRLELVAKVPGPTRMRNTRLWGGERYLIVDCERRAFVCYRLNDRQLDLLGTLVAVGRPGSEGGGGFRIQMLPVHEPPTGSRIGINLVGLFRETIIVQKKVPHQLGIQEIYMVTMEPFEVKVLDTSSLPHIESSVFLTGRLFLEGDEVILCYDERGTEKLSIPKDLLFQDLKNGLKANDRVVAQFWSVNISDVVVRLWDWRGRSVLQQIVFMPHFSFNLMELHPFMEAIIYCEEHHIVCRNLLRDCEMWRTEHKGKVGWHHPWHPYQLVFLSPHFLVLVCDSFYTVYDLRTGLEYFTNSKPSDTFMAKSSNYHFLIFEEFGLESKIHLFRKGWEFSQSELNNWLESTHQSIDYM